ncbi:type I toxin-antitoxin system Fst family toxin [Staphylococcus simiae]|nr:type I toxin-antitoxin system Fst family toxin [Staphylococcus simiae]MBO1201076.1 type I toxin-antitoxin system Fst family toxin [Staphylococcus simiae]MBO1203298.1 type I toxin-antitoxin system Fst family toxin [Staphylococcus simiae]MBO1210753.1 type I toxin-antitoxin system Fst family toxin [Staphylococcus simiae]MBO1229414.1 type I toxin-antitoxin system Fst family toxin [Staphylococcus simiae]
MMNLIITTLASIISGCVIAAFKHWLSSRSDKRR